MVVIVGQNGSGKSSLANLLTGLCQPGSGDIFIDGIKSSFFRREDLAQATASLTQDHRVLPLSIAENIGLGSASEQHNMSRIYEAAALGGATGFISKFSDGLDHSLDALRECFSYGALPDGPLADFAREFRQSTDISGALVSLLSHVCACLIGLVYIRWRETTASCVSHHAASEYPALC
jgi:ABC-type dipeptide/oligopeptide/nickel transport system ATPase component